MTRLNSITRTFRSTLHSLAFVSRNKLRMLCVAGVACQSSWGLAADETKTQVADGPWISSVAWQDDSILLGTRSQGLLFRPAEVVRTTSSDPTQLTVVGESENSLWSILPTANGQAIASDYKGGLHVFSGSGEKEKPDEPKDFELDARWIRALAQSPTANEILAGTEDGKLLVLAVDQTKELRRVDAHAAAIFDIAFSSAGDKVATAAGDGTIKIFSWPKLEQQAEMKVGKDAIWSLAFVNKDQQIVSGGADRAIQLWDVASASSIVTIATAHNWVTSIVPLPKSSFVAAGCMDGSVVVVDYLTMQAVDSQPVAASAIWSMALSPDGKQLAVATRKHGMSVVKVQPWKKAGRAVAKQTQAIRPPAPKRS